MLLLLLACAHPKHTPGVELPDAVCDAGRAPWSAGTPIFTETQDDWGLTGLGVVAQRFHVADFDGDGWPDVLARLSSGSDSFAEGGARIDWLLRNTGVPGQRRPEVMGWLAA